MAISAFAVALALAGAPAAPGDAITLNLIHWGENQLPKVYERSAQLPLTDDEVAKLTRARIAPAALVKMIEERRCACDASADGLLRLRNAGASPEVVSAVSLHALAPNRSLTLEVTLDFAGEGAAARDGHLYLFVDDGGVTRVLTLNVAELLGRKNAHESAIDRSDLLRVRQVRRIRFAGQLPLKTYGKHTLLVAASANPAITDPSQLTERERGAARSHAFDYPRASLQSVCRLAAGYARDPVLAHRWEFKGSRFDCEWD